jgi:hypothetical protein
MSTDSIMFDSRYMGTITGISDLDPARWPNSHWRSVKVWWNFIVFCTCICEALFLMIYSEFFFIVQF